jgi:integrase/recombinase XerD
MAQEHTTSIIPETTEQARDAFRRSVEAKGSSSHTLEVYARHTEYLCHELKALGIQDMSQLTTDHLESFFEDLQAKHNRGGVHCYYRSIRAWLRWYWDKYDIPSRNPIDKIRIDPPAGKPKPGIPMEHFKRMVDACKTKLGLRDKAMLFCLLDSCCRATEFVSINIGDVDFVTGHVLVRHGKGDKRRTVRFGDKAMRALRKYLKTRGDRLPDRQPLFQTDQGERFDRFSLRLMLDRRADDAKVPHYGLHDIRRRGALELKRNGMHIKDISVYLGHSSVKVTELYLAIEDEEVLSSHRVTSPVDNAF